MTSGKRPKLNESDIWLSECTVAVCMGLPQDVYLWLFPVCNPAPLSQSSEVLACKKILFCRYQVRLKDKR